VFTNFVNRNAVNKKSLTEKLLTNFLGGGELWGKITETEKAAIKTARAGSEK
jgi:hypothetical protein